MNKITSTRMLPNFGQLVECKLHEARDLVSCLPSYITEVKNSAWHEVDSKCMLNE